MWEGHHNYTFNAATVLRDLYRLIAMLMADRSIAVEADGQDDPLCTLRDRFIEDEMVHLLVGTAVLNRSQEEHMRGFREDADELAFEPLAYACGSLTPDVKTGEEIVLSFREACNKIIHAEHITAETEEDPGYAFPVIPMALIVRGHRGDQSWQARLDVVEYVRASVKNFSDLG